MKKTLHYLRMALILLPLLVIISCRKSDSTGTPSCTTCSSTPAPVLIVTATPDTVWYSGTSVINWSSTNATSVTMTGGSISGTSGSFTTPSLITPTIYTIIATGPGGSTSKQVNVYVWSQIRTWLCWDDNLHQNKKWLMSGYTITVVSTGSTTNGNLDCNFYTYWTNNIRQVTIGACNPNPGTTGIDGYQLLNNDTQINFGYTYNPPYTWNIDSLNGTTLVISKIQLDADGISRKRVLTYQKIP